MKPEDLELLGITTQNAKQNENHDLAAEKPILGSFLKRVMRGVGFEPT